MEMQMANTVTKVVMNMMGGDHTKGRPIAAVVAWCTPKLSRAARTMAMMMNAAHGLRFSRIGVRRAYRGKDRRRRGR